MKRFSFKAWGLFAFAASCLILYLCFAPQPAPSARHSANTTNPSSTANPSAIASASSAEAEDAPLKTPATQDPLSDLPEPGERVGIRGHGILLRAQAGLKAKVVRESEAGESFYATGETAIADDLAWVELELSPGTKAWISKGFIQRKRDMLAFEPVLTLPKASPSTNPQAKTADSTLENPHLKSAAYWSKYPARVRQDISMKLAIEILKSSETAYTPDHAIALEGCIDASSKAPDLQSLKIYELASTCAIALNW